MATGHLICPICGEGLPSVPRTCRCGRFWASPAELDADRRSRRADSADDEPTMVLPSAGDFLPCGHPGPPSAQCAFCGWTPPVGAATQTMCLVVESRALELPQSTAIRLGREAGWRQVRDLLGGYPGISREHVEITVETSQVQLRDLGSMNGTYIDDRELGQAPVRRPIPLQFRLGMSVTAEIRTATEHDEIRRWTGEQG